MLICCAESCETVHGERGGEEEDAGAVAEV